MSTPADYNVQLRDRAVGQLDRLPADVHDRVDEELVSLRAEPRPRGCKKLKGTKLYRVRVGSYRVLYEIDDKRRIVEVVSVLHRKDVYRGM